MIKKITISGFRGIRVPLELDFQSGTKPNSMIIYGRNGTGKSSITDAWEWFQTGKVAHLSREGAEQSSYPNKDSKMGETYIEVEFKDLKLNTIRMDFDFNRVTIPTISGKRDEFLKIAQHPCQIRFEDLTRFVYFKKAERYDQLAEFMGFSEQVEYQKSLRRVENRYQEFLQTANNDVYRLNNELKSVLNDAETSEKNILDHINRIFVFHRYPKIDAFQQIDPILGDIKTEIEVDPIANELSELQKILSLLTNLDIHESITSKLPVFIKSYQEYLNYCQVIVDLAMIDIYEIGEKVIQNRRQNNPEDNTCPLCGETFLRGDLLAHVHDESRKLSQIKQKRDNFIKYKEYLLKEFHNIPQPSSFQEELRKIDPKPFDVNLLLREINIIEGYIGVLQKIVEEAGRDKNQLPIQTFEEKYRDLSLSQNRLVQIIKDNKTFISEKIKHLSEQSQRTKLVDDFSLINTLITLHKKSEMALNKKHKIEQILSVFSHLISDYINKSNEVIRRHFQAITTDVQNYYSILEAHTNGISKPTLKLLTTQDRAVELEIEFHGDTVFPAYKYLSESQLNSFGLSIFLASVKFFNPNFRFIILDDVINSFDGYKRPQVIELLRKEFSDFQVLLFTHDNVWRDRLFESCPSWIKRDFSRYEIKSGPIVLTACTPLEDIEEIKNKKPAYAGTLLGPYLERQLQELCEKTEVLVKYNKRNEYSLDPLFDRFRLRIEEKLGKTHILSLAIRDSLSEKGFRNLSSHWKNPDIQITEEEIQIVIDKWNNLKKLVWCENCCNYIKYSGTSFSCDCKQLKHDFT